MPNFNEFTIESELPSLEIVIPTKKEVEPLLTDAEQSKLITKAINNYNINVEDARELTNQTKELTIETHGYEKIKIAWQILKNTRIDVEKTGKLLREFPNKYNKLVKAAEDERINILSPEEDRLYNIKKAHEDELERIKEEKKEAARLKLQDRVNRLAKFDVVLDLGYLEALTDESFEMVIAREEQLWQDAEILRLEQQKAELEEQQRLADLKLAEEQKLQKENEELKAKLEASEKAKKELADTVYKQEQEIKEKSATPIERTPTNSGPYTTTPPPKVNGNEAEVQWEKTKLDRAYFRELATKLNEVILHNPAIKLDPMYEKANTELKKNLMTIYNYLLKTGRHDRLGNNASV